MSEPLSLRTNSASYTTDLEDFPQSISLGPKAINYATDLNWSWKRWRAQRKAMQLRKAAAEQAQRAAEQARRLKNSHKKMSGPPKYGAKGYKAWRLKVTSRKSAAWLRNFVNKERIQKMRFEAEKIAKRNRSRSNTVSSRRYSTRNVSRKPKYCKKPSFRFRGLRSKFTRMLRCIKYYGKNRCGREAIRYVANCTGKRGLAEATKGKSFKNRRNGKYTRCLRRNSVSYCRRRFKIEATIDLRIYDKKYCYGKGLNVYRTKHFGGSIKYAIKKWCEANNIEATIDLRIYDKKYCYGKGLNTYRTKHFGGSIKYAIRKWCEKNNI